jgi:hypothetical protein
MSPKQNARIPYNLETAMEWISGVWFINNTSGLNKIINPASTSTNAFI